MVAPSWGTFQKPGQQIAEQESEFQEELPGELVDQEKPEGEKPQWGNFQSPETYQGEPDPTADEGIFDYVVRNAAANTSRVVEQIAGRYGNVEKFAKDTLSNIPETGGLVSWAISQLVGPERWEKIVRGNEGQQQLLPTSQQIKGASEKLTGGYTKPKTEGEAKFQEFTEDVGVMVSGRRAPNITGMTRGQRARQQAFNKVLIPAAANVTKEIVDDLGFGKDKANMAKMAVWLPLSLASNVNAAQYSSHLMNEGRNGIPQTLNCNVPRLQQRLQQVANDPHLLHADPRSALARQELAAIQNDLANGQTSVRSLMTSYDGINAAKRNRGLFELNRNDQAFARRAIDRVRDAVRDEIMSAGAGHPEALNNWRSGIQAWSVVHRSRAITNWIDNVARGPYAKILTGPTAGLFGVSSYAGFKAPLVALPTAALTPAAYKTGQTLYRVWNDPNLANYYWNAIGAAANENLPTFLNNYNKMNKILEKSDSTKKKSKSKKD